MSQAMDCLPSSSSSFFTLAKACKSSCLSGPVLLLSLCCPFQWLSKLLGNLPRPKSSCTSSFLTFHCLKRASAEQARQSDEGGNSEEEEEDEQEEEEEEEEEEQVRKKYELRERRPIQQAKLYQPSFGGQGTR